MKNEIFYDVVLSREISSAHVFSQPIRNHTLVSHQVKFDPDLFYKLTTVRSGLVPQELIIVLLLCGLFLNAASIDD